MLNDVLPQQQQPQYHLHKVCVNDVSSSNKNDVSINARRAVESRFHAMQDS